MTDWTMQSTERDPRILLGTFLQRRTSSAKDLARQIGCDPRSAESYRAGRYWPQAKHWPAIVAAFGRDVTEAVFHPEAAAERLEREVKELERQAEERRAALRELQSFAPRGAKAAARLQDRSPHAVARDPAPDA
jgi:hypothetical protein